MSEYLNKKAVLELEMPESCMQCLFYKVTGICDVLSSRNHHMPVYTPSTGRRHDCPLKPVKEESNHDRTRPEDERCPKCGANLLGNKVGDKWCSLVGCDYDINEPERVGTEEWRHKYFGAKWPKVEGDGNDA